MSTAVANPAEATGEREPFIEVLERLRSRLGMSQAKFAQHIGVNPATYSLVLRGLRPCGFAFIGRVMTRISDELVDDPVVQKTVWRTGKETAHARA